MTAQHCFALTPGEPAGIGPDLCLLLARQAQPVPLVAIASRELLAERAKQLGLNIELLTVGRSNGQTAPQRLAVSTSGIRPWRHLSSPAN